MVAVLVVANSPFHRRLIPAVLEGEHDVVGTAESGVEAVDRHEALEPEVVLMGWELPIRNGVDAAEEITGSGSQTSVVLFGDPPDAERRHDADAAGVCEFLVTPYRRQGVIDAIQRA